MKASSSSRQEIDAQDLNFNFVVHAIDAAFFGMALGLASFVTVMPLLLSRFTDSRLLIGMIASVQPLGWHLPQVLMAGRVASRDRLMPTILRMTTIERLPFFLLAGLAWMSVQLPAEAVILGIYLLVFWIGIGGGLTATPFQEMVGRIVPPRRWGLFYGVKTAAATATIALASVASGRLLERRPGPESFALLCLGAGLATVVSFYFLALTRERGRDALVDTDATLDASSDEASEVVSRVPLDTALISAPHVPPSSAQALARISPAQPLTPADSLEAKTAPIGLATAFKVLRSDLPFRWYLLARATSQFTVMTAGYYTVLALRRFDAGAELIGWLAASLAIAQALSNPIMGWAGDRWGHRNVMAGGMLAGSLAAFLALLAPNVLWLFPAYLLTGIAMNASFVIPLSLNLRFGDAHNRPVYIGLSSTVTAPSIVLAPLIGGYVMERFGFDQGFVIAVVGGVVAAVIVRWKVSFPTAH